MTHTKKEPVKHSFKITIMFLADLLLMSISFFATYVFASESIIETGFNYGDVYLALAIYDILFSATLILLGCYKKKNIVRPVNSIIGIILATIASHLIYYTIFSLADVKLKFGIIVVGAMSCVLIILCHTLQKIISDYYLSSIYKANATGIPTLIIGAGFTGKMVYRELTEMANGELHPVCFVDDDENVISTEICGLHVYGPTVLIPELCKKHKIGMIVFAIPSCPPEQRKRILANCSNLKCDVRIIPSLNELTEERAFFKQAHTIDVEKLLGRDAISLKNNMVSEYIKDKVCLVTGGGGSIGSELCRQIVRMDPKRVVIVDIYENNAYDIQQELARFGYGTDMVSVEIASVRDIEKMRVIFAKYNFDVIFHAAAHKHVPLMETNPEEAIKNNVKGTYNIAHLAHRFGVEKMVLISTDKAVNPTNAMGASKRVCEMLMQYMSQTYKGTLYTAVRFGNVLGSNGSVIPLFAKQIEAGGPVTVTHPDIIRYFMTIPEAVSLVLEAGTVSTGGETFVLDMGEPVKIVSLAENLIKMYGYQPYKDMKIEFCGLRQGEKLYEELLMSEENLKTTHNKKIFISNQLEIDCAKFKDDLQILLDIADKNDSKQTIEILHKIVPNYKTPVEVNGSICYTKEIEKTGEAVKI